MVPCGGIAFTKGPLAYLLRSRVYVGEVVHKGRHYPGEHEPILATDVFEAVQQALAAKATGKGPRANTGSLLAGRIYDDRGNPMRGHPASLNPDLEVVVFPPRDCLPLGRLGQCAASFRCLTEERHVPRLAFNRFRGMLGRVVGWGTSRAGCSGAEASASAS